MSTNCVVCVVNKRTGPDLLCDSCRVARRYSGVTVALSVRQPWAWLIVNGFKDVENRDWRTDFKAPLLIHAGKKYGAAEKKDAEIVRAEFGIEIPETLELGGIVGAVTMLGCVSRSPSRWWREGSYAFVLRDAVVMPFREMRGFVGFFNVVGGRSFMGREVEV